MKKIISIIILMLVIITSIVYISSARSNVLYVEQERTFVPEEKISTSTDQGVVSTSTNIVSNSCLSYAGMNLPDDYDQFKEIKPMFSETHYNSVHDLRGDGMCGTNSCGAEGADETLPKAFPKGIPDNIDQLRLILRGNFRYQLYGLYADSLTPGDAGRYGMIFDALNSTFKLYHHPDAVRNTIEAQKQHDVIHFALFTHRDRIYYYKAGDTTFHLIASSTLQAPETYFRGGDASSTRDIGDAYTFSTFNCNNWKRSIRTITFDLNAIDKAQSAASSTYR